MKYKRILSLTLSLSILFVTISSVGTTHAFAAGKKLTIEQARNMAVASSSEISKKQNELILKQTKYLESVDAITAKVKNKQTLRWSPLLSFKFPQPLAMVDEYDVNVKPLVLQSEITVLKHAIRDLKYDVLSKVSNQYVKLYTTQEKMSFANSRLQIAKQQLARNKARLLTGQATKDDVEKSTKAVDKLTSEVGNLGRDFEAGKKELSDMTKLNVTSNYVFTNPMQALNLPRNELQKIIDYTLANDQGYYEAQMEVTITLMNLNAYEKLLNNNFNKEMALIRQYISGVKEGKDVDFAAFKLAYKQMLKEMDQPWAGSWKFWFFSFPYEWFKGEVDGTRYIEDELYAPYTACMDYNNAVKAEQAAKKALIKQVESEYNTLVNTYNSYKSFDEAMKKSNEQLQRTSELNRQGRAEFSELQEALEAYESAQLDTMDALSSYNELLNSFDRLTCGEAGRYLSGAGMATESGDVIDRLDTVNEPYYYIYSSVQDMKFHVGISIPTTFVPAINQYELWLGDIQIGTRTDLKNEITHMSLDYASDPMMTVKLYYNNTFVGQSTIDAQIPHDRLVLEGTLAPPKTREVIGSYTTSTQQDGEVNTSTLTFELDSRVAAASYNLTYKSNISVYTGEHMPIDMPFNYLTILIPSLEEITLELYDKDGKLIHEAGFNTADMTITIPIETTGGAA